MRKNGLFSLLMVCFMFLSCSATSFAAPKTMSDGQTFDAEFYASQYPDVAAAIGNDEAKLYEHYVQFGKAEGRLPYAAAVSATAPSSNDLVVGNIDETTEKQAEMQAGYAALPQNVKNFFNRKNIKIYAATKDYIGTVNTRKSIGYTRTSWDANGNFTEAVVYVCGSSFMPPKYTLYHELGHILDFRKMYSNNWEGWTEMQPYSPTQVYSASEAFAEAFAGYFERPDKLKKTAPYAYAYIENIILNMQ